MTRILLPLLAFSVLAAADAAPAAKPTPYPLDTCIITGEKLGSMGDAVVIVREGREIKLCCKGCVKDVDKDVTGTIKKIDEAAAKAKAKATK